MVGGHDYVGYVDSDDYVLAGVGNVVRQALQHHPHGVVTRQWIENEAGGRYSVPKNGHGLAVYRRELVAPLFDELRARPPRRGCRRDGSYSPETASVYRKRVVASPRGYPCPVLTRSS